MQDVSPYVASYVRRIAVDENRRGELLAKLTDGQPFVESEYMAVAMIDIAGYSGLTSYFNEQLGKFSSEAISEAVGEYMNKIASIVLAYGGDIIKFLGDAILVSFASSPNRANHTSITAVACCCEVLMNCPAYNIDFKRWTNAIRVHPSEIRTEDHNVAYTSGASTISTDDGGGRSTLSLHVAVTAGMVSHVIVGDPESRLDYYVEGTCFEDLGKLLDEAKSGELGISNSVLQDLPMSPSDQHFRNGHMVVSKNRLDAISRSLRVATVSQRPTLRRTLTTASAIVDTPVSSFVNMFVNKSVLFRIKSKSASNIQIDAGNGDSIRPSAFTPVVNVRNDFRNEYRTLSVLFVKFVKTVGPDETQHFLERFLEKVNQFDGVFQQCSVDDKGQTFLACFGLPPFSHEKCGLFALKAAIAFVSELANEDANILSLAVATGDILFGTVGTADRKEARLLGDVFNLASRLLNVKREIKSVAIDFKTQQMVSDHYSCVDLGKFKLKGKDGDIQVWSVEASPLSPGRRQSLFPKKETLIGNFSEWKVLQENFESWFNGRTDQFIASVEGASGMGKSNLISYCHKYLRDNLVESCIIRGNEVEQSSPYCILQIILSKLLPFILDDDDESPMSNRPSAGATKSFMTLSPDNGISRVLEKCGEIPAYASLIARLAAGGSISDVDNNPLSKMLRDGFKPTTSKFIAYILREYRIALLLDDVQWFDRISLDVLYEITKISTNILLVVFSRPVDASHAINSIAFDVRLQLSGLRHEEVQAFLLKAFGITINNPQLIDSIIEKTNGNLLQVDTLASYLADKYPGGNARIGDYKFSQSLDNLFSTKIETIILAKFDSLHPRLQTILRLASLFGQYFSVGDVLFLFCDESDEQVTSKSLIVDMRQFDKHDFLKIETDPKGGFSDDDPNIFFRHITIKNAIYDNISLVERQAMHQKIAQRYEDHVRLHPDERKSKMPTIYHHYWKSGMHGKIIHIGFELGCAFCADGHYYDATKYFLDITEMEQNASEDMKYGKEVLMSRKMKAEALAKLAWSSTSILPPSKVKHFAIDALALYGVTWPVDRKGATKAVVRSIFKVFQLWIWTRGGLAQGKAPVVKDLEPLDLALYALMILSNLDESFEIEYKAMVLIWRVQYALSNNRRNPENCFTALSFAALVISKSKLGCIIARAFLKKCRLLRLKYPNMACTPFNIYAIAVTNLFLDPMECLKACALHTSYWTERKNEVELFKGSSPIGQANFFVGNLFDINPQVTVVMIREMFPKDAFWTTAVLLILLNESFFVKNDKAFQTWRNLLEELVSSIPKKTQAVFGYFGTWPSLLCALMSGKNDKDFVQSMVLFAEELATYSFVDNHFTSFFAAVNIFMAVSMFKSSPCTAIVDSENLQKVLSVIKQKFIKVAGFSLLFEVSSVCGRAAFHHFLGQGHRMIPQIKAILRRKSLFGRLSEGGDLVSLGALMCSCIGILSTDCDDKRIYSHRAAAMFRNMGGVMLEKFALEQLSDDIDDESDLRPT